MEDSFEITLLDSGDPALAIAVGRRGCDLTFERLSCHQLQKLLKFRLHIAESIDGVKNRPSITQLKRFGQDLFDLIFQKNIQTIYSRLPDSHIRLQILSDHPDFQSLPWEYIQKPGDTPGPNSKRSIVRIVPTIGIPPPPPIELSKSVRMLFVCADPIDQDAVDWPDIKATIESAFYPLLPGTFELDVVEGATRKALIDALDKKDYEILHFAGHGQIIDGEGHLLLLDLKTQKSDPISATQLGTLFRDKKLDIVVLSACSTSGGDFTKEFAVIAKTLVQSGVPAVVANQFPISNSAAATFAKSFYSEMLQSGDVDLATTKGRVRLYTEMSLKNQDANLEYGIPTLFRHIGASCLFKLL